MTISITSLISHTSGSINEEGKKKKNSSKQEVENKYNRVVSSAFSGAATHMDSQLL